MNAVIVDIKGRWAAALKEDGCVEKIPNAAYEFGQEIELFEKKPQAFRLPLRRISGLAAAAALVLALGAGTAYAMPYGVVSLDVNPAVEYTINCFDYVLSAHGVNEDGKELLETMDQSQLCHRKIEAAVSATMEQLEAADYLSGERNSVLVSAGTKSEAHSEKLLARLEEESREAGYEFYGEQVSMEEVESAREAGLTAGRQQMIQRLGEINGEGFSPEDWAERPVQEIAEAFGRPAEGRPQNEAPQPADAADEEALPGGERPDRSSEAEPPALPEQLPGEGLTPPFGAASDTEAAVTAASGESPAEVPQGGFAPPAPDGNHAPPAGPGGDFPHGNGQQNPSGGKT
ncbi:MAG: hypothetical protein K6C08_00375 [Oscillospiraceae bacterium]|nr:hypothetical protein [Oscillospiraceae bacterium]